MNQKDWKKFQDIAPGRLYGATVVDNDINRAIRKWKKVLKDSNIIQEVFDRREYIQDSKKKRKILQTAQYKQRKEHENNQ